MIFAQSGFSFDWEYATSIVPAIARGLLETVIATLVGITIGMILGLVLALLRRTRIKAIRWPVIWIIEFIRSTPLLVQLFFIFYVMPQLGLTLSPFVALVVGLGLHYGTYTSESYRAGIDNVEWGQWE